MNRLVTWRDEEAGVGRPRSAACFATHLALCSWIPCLPGVAVCFATHSGLCFFTWFGWTVAAAVGAAASVAAALRAAMVSMSFWCLAAASSMAAALLAVMASTSAWCLACFSVTSALGCTSSLTRA